MKKLERKLFEERINSVKGKALLYNGTYKWLAEKYISGAALAIRDGNIIATNENIHMAEVIVSGMLDNLSLSKWNGHLVFS